MFLKFFKVCLRVLMGYNRNVALQPKLAEHFCRQLLGSSEFSSIAEGGFLAFPTGSSIPFKNFQEAI